MWTSIATWARALAAPLAHQPDGLTDNDIQAMARRQFRVSVAVGLALLGAAALILVRTPRVGPAAISAHHKIMRPETPRLDTADPTAGRVPRG
jgi:hypothetical protein